MSNLLFEVVRVQSGFACARMYASSNVDLILHVLGAKVAVIVLLCELDHFLALGFT